MTAIDSALEICARFGGTEEWHHQSWVIDQIVQCLTGSGYGQWVSSVTTSTPQPCDSSPAGHALRIAAQHGCVEDSPFQRWVIDQMVRALTGTNYDSWVANYRCPDPTKPDEVWDWSEGIPPREVAAKRTEVWYAGIAP